MSAILEIKKLNVAYGTRQALDGVSLTVPQRKITALIGASGSGKSTLLRVLNRLTDLVPEADVQGVVRFCGKNCLDPDLDVIAHRRKIGMVFQNPSPFPKSVYDNIAFGLEIQGHPKPFRAPWRPVEKTGVAVAASQHPMDLAVVNSLKEAALWDEVQDRLFASAYRLSGGQQQRLCIARVIAVQPDVLLLDEPCSQLDPISTKKIEDLLLRLKKRYTIIIVTHNMQQARRVSDYTAFFHMGKLVEHGTTKQIFTKPKNSQTRAYVRGEFG